MKNLVKIVEPMSRALKEAGYPKTVLVVDPALGVRFGAARLRPYQEEDGRWSAEFNFDMNMTLSRQILLEHYLSILQKNPTLFLSMLAFTKYGTLFLTPEDKVLTSVDTLMSYVNDSWALIEDFPVSPFGSDYSVTTIGKLMEDRESNRLSVNFRIECLYAPAASKENLVRDIRRWFMPLMTCMGVLIRPGGGDITFYTNSGGFFLMHPVYGELQGGVSYLPFNTWDGEDTVYAESDLALI
ncbi:hypothetical protein [Pseudomonas sp. NFACC08-1]|uniref:hypothetical protein n=1 Tax=Pseudomonas sp. NFACC08-1 TaxID=1566238 RepID=UPI000895EE09|nr:hypothetical protein [Pseudomonas sp. NFACC08-1]SDX01286.1 hypothetical protein SAMN03159474_02017 [Pseudomonas sp. NFACC08-1]